MVGEAASMPVTSSPLATLIRKGAADAGRSSQASSIVQRMTSSLQWRQAHSNQDMYPVALDDGRTLLLRQLQAGEETGLGTGATVWPAAHVLAKYIERRFGTNGMRHSRVVELGSGTGAVGLVAAYLGAQESIMTDQEQLMFLLRENAEMAVRDLRIRRDAIRTVTYEWGAETAGLSPPVDVVLVSDCVVPKLYPIEPLVEAIDKLSGPHTLTLFSYEHRHYEAYDPRRKFEELAARRGLTKALVPPEQHHPVISADDVEIWEIRRAVPASNETCSQPKTTETSASAARDDVDITVSRDAFGKSLVRLLGEHHELAEDLSGSIGCYLWPSAVVVARHVARNTCDFPSRPIVLELGSGVGLVAMTMAMLGWHVVATDKADALPLLKANVERCLSSTKREAVGTADVVSFDWGRDVDGLLTRQRTLQQSSNVGYDLVICADCVYATSSIQPLLTTLRQVCHAGTTVLMANELRSAFDDFLRSAREYFTVRNVPVPAEQLVFDSKRNQDPTPIVLKLLQRRCMPQDTQR